MVRDTTTSVAIRPADTIAVKQRANKESLKMLLKEAEMNQKK